MLLAANEPTWTNAKELPRPRVCKPDCPCLAPVCSRVRGRLRPTVRASKRVLKSRACFFFNTLQAKLAEALTLLGAARAEADKANAAAEEARKMSARLLSALQASASEVKAEADRMRKNAN